MCRRTVAAGRIEAYRAQRPLTGDLYDVRSTWRRRRRDARFANFARLARGCCTSAPSRAGLRAQLRPAAHRCRGCTCASAHWYARGLRRSSRGRPGGLAAARGARLRSGSWKRNDGGRSPPAAGCKAALANSGSRGSPSRISTSVGDRTLSGPRQAITTIHTSQCKQQRHQRVERHAVGAGGKPAACAAVR